MGPTGVAEAVEMGLVGSGVPVPLAQQAIRVIPSKVSGVLLYGSRARGDALPDSDLDLLAVVPFSRSGDTRGLVSVSCYTQSQLQTASGTLFGAHLARDARILFDPQYTIRAVLSSMGEVDTDRLIARIRNFSCVLDANPRDMQSSINGLVREARYLLRSALYGNAIRHGTPCFSLRELASSLHDPKLVELLSSRSQEHASAHLLADLRKRLSNILGELPSNAHGSLDALIVNESISNPDLAAVGILAKGKTGGSDPYEEFDKVLL